MGKRGSGPPRRPRNPVAKAVRTPQYKPRVEQDKRWQERVKASERVENPALTDQNADVQDVDQADRGQQD